MHAIEDFDLGALANGDHGGCEITKAVDGENRCALEVGREERARRMAQVVLDIVDLGVQVRGIDLAGLCHE